MFENQTRESVSVKRGTSDTGTLYISILWLEKWSSRGGVSRDTFRRSQMVCMDLIRTKH